MLNLQSISIYSKQQTLLNDISVTVENGEILTLMGPSGIGKSSLLSYLTGTLAKELRGTGEIWLNQERIDRLPPEQRSLGLLQQSPLLFPHMTVAENLLFALKWQGSKQERREKVKNRLDEFGLTDLGERLPNQLSGGQQARLALLRTLLSDPKALLLDEPFSKLDRELRLQIRSLVKQQIEQAQIPVILVTHDQEDAEDLAARIITL